VSAEATGADDRFWSRPQWTGLDYMEALRRFHEVVKPSTYFEIGVDRGRTLAIAQCASIGVDPAFRGPPATVNNKPSCFLFNCRSDAFFHAYDPTKLFGRPIDLAFLDGLHHFEVLLRDFLHTEKHCRRDSVVLLHDCLPFDAHMARREQGDATYRAHSAYPGHWTGDVWKTLAILKKVRNDLKIVVYDAGPTGLVAVTDLDPCSTALEERYSELFAEFEPKDLFDEVDAFYASLDVRSVGDDLSALSLEFRP
jgi:hypothetical protein